MTVIMQTRCGCTRTLNYPSKEMPYMGRYIRVGMIGPGFYDFAFRDFDVTSYDSVSDTMTFRERA